MSLPNPYYQDGWVTIYHGDCREVLPELPKVDLVLADFPYNISDYGNSITKVGSKFVRADFGEWDKFTLENYSKWVIEIMRLLETKLQLKHQAYCWFDNHYAGLFTYLIENQTTFTQKCPIVCYKRNPIPQLHKRNFRSSYEMCILYTRDKDKKCEPFNFLSQSEMKNVQEYNLQKVTNHPTEKPVEIVSRFINISSNVGDLVLDPFLGSGTTAYCAKKLNRKCIGIEIKEKYCEIAAKRCSQGVFDLSMV